ADNTREESMEETIRRTFAWGVVLVALTFVPTRSVAECTNTICSGNPSCTITGSHTISDGCLLDFSGKSVTIASGAVLTTNGTCNIGPDLSCPSFRIRAATLTHTG